MINLLYRDAGWSTNEAQKIKCSSYINRKKHIDDDDLDNIIKKKGNAMWSTIICQTHPIQTSFQ